MRIKLTRDDVQKIASLRSEGVTVRKIGEITEIPFSTVHFTLKKLESNPDWFPVKVPRKKINPIGFNEPISPESAYWVGFLITDGCVYGNAVILTLASRDFDHLVKFKQFLKFKSSIRTYDNGTGKKGQKLSRSVVSFRSKETVENLAAFGVKPRKTHTAQISKLEFDRDFWRGAIDGDGCICIGNESSPNHVHLVFVGSSILAQQFLDYCKSVTETKARCRQGKSVYIVALSGMTAVRVIHHLYKNCSIALDRKLNLANRVIDLWGHLV